MGGPTGVPQGPGPGSWGMSSTELECPARVYRRSEQRRDRALHPSGRSFLPESLIPRRSRVRATSLQRFAAQVLAYSGNRPGRVAAVASGKGWGRASAGRRVQPPAGARSGCWMLGAGAWTERRGRGASPTRTSRARLLLEKAVSLAGGGRRPLPLRLGLTPVWR